MTARGYEMPPEDTCALFLLHRRRTVSASAGHFLRDQAVYRGEWVPVRVFVCFKLGAGGRGVRHVLAEQAREQRGSHVHACRYA